MHYVSRKITDIISERVVCSLEKGKSVMNRRDKEVSYVKMDVPLYVYSCILSVVVSATEMSYIVRCHLLRYS